MMLGMKKDKKDEESTGGGNPFNNLDKTSVLQEARTFNETPINARKCCHILTKILYLLNQGETFGRNEATGAFFAITKLWQSKDNTLRRMVYLAVKELSVMADDVIIVTSSLTKDMTGKEDAYRAAAIRTLVKITDASMLQAIERYMKQAIVDKVPSVASAALVSSLHLMKQSPEVVKRWVNEVQEAVNSDNTMVQFHALGVLYNIRKSDRLAVNKLVQKFSKQGLKSSYAICYLIRIASKLIDEDDAGPGTPLYDFIESCLRHKTEVVTLEAASAIVGLRNVTPKELAPAVTALQLFCSSPKPSLRFAAVRTLSKVAINHPQAVTGCNVDLENLINDSNRSIATLAITTLLKTGAEASVDRLMKQISSFVSEISDEFKIVVIQAIRQLCMRYPRKHQVMMTFLSTMLRDEGGFEYKKAIVDTIISIIEENPDAKEAGLGHLCEFIEDCEHTVLATRILHLLGREGPKSLKPAKYIRFIYNRVVLENATVRAAAVTSLAKFGAQCEALLPSVKVLLARCLLDDDDEVRDRATYYLTVLTQSSSQMNSQYILNGLQVSIVGLERALQDYCAEPQEKPFDIKTVPLATVPVVSAASERRRTASLAEQTPKKEEKVRATRQDVYAEQLASIPEFSGLGPLFKSCEPVELTESETEYVVHCVKHVFKEHVVLQFDCRNTLNDQILENVTVAVETAADGFNTLASINCPKLVYNQPGSTYVLVGLPEDQEAVTATFTCILKFTVKDCDPNTLEPESDEGYADEYVLEDVEITVADHVQRVVKPNFAAAWEEVGDECQKEDTYVLSTVTTLEEAVKNLIKFLGLGVAERSDKIGEGKASHTLLLSGVFRGGVDVLVRAKLALNPSDASVTMNFTVRSTDAAVSEVFNSAVG